MIAMHHQATETAAPRSHTGTSAMSRLVVVALVLLPALAGCPAAGEDVQPPADQFFFPTGLAIAPDQDTLYVLNANSDLRWNAGAIDVVDLKVVQALARGWTDEGAVPDGRDCEVDAQVRSTLVCNEREAIVEGAGVRIGNFATELAVQALDDGRQRLFAAVRGDPSLTWVDYDGRRLSCGDDDGSFPDCDDDHRLTRMRDDPSLFDLPDEPYDVYVDSTDGFAVVTHLTEGSVTIADAPPDGSRPILSDAIGGLFALNQTTGLVGAGGVAGRAPGSDPDRIYVTSRSEARIQTMTVGWPTGTRAQGGFPVLVPSAYFYINRVLPSDDARGIAFSADGDRAYVVNRDPPMLQILDTSIGPDGAPSNELVGAVELCQGANNLAVADQGEGDRIYVACFRAGQVWVVDPVAGVVDAVTPVGGGPDGIAIAPGRGQLYVTNFLEDTMAVIDIRPGVPTENQLVLRLGRSRQAGGR
jgi:DNA-binding beta-propeller fold protein YncE